MNTKTMEQFNVLNADTLATVEGGIGPVTWGIIAGYVAGQVVDAAIDDLTEQCRKNPKQWFCIRV
ncbi:bacteriocin [Streptococcus suis]|nr:bacteriocin class II family protein [Streptococcus suis]NQJ68583.1 bacteriocin [Streptococcus suis]NQJ72819.1 bacteriocin [Streptococcus suis]NQJ76095.1 bacteriocin [Streptococcus suis]NRG69727.1 bacteriocin [Streptococcus suis]